MKRDDDFLRDLLFRMEAEDDYEWMSFDAVAKDGSDEKEYYHILLLEDAGLVSCVSPVAHSVRLTNRGHDFIAAIRTDTTWNKTKEVALKSGTATLSVMFDIAVALGKKKVSDLIGLEV